MKLLVLILLWFVNAVVLGVVFALFEILLERERGWASGMNPNGWGRRLLEGSFIARIFEKPYFTAYHCFVFVCVVPAVLIGECMLGFSTRLLRPSAVPPVLGFLKLAQIGNVQFVLVFFAIAVWLSFMVVEDFLWFLWNWYYPGSAKDLFSGRIWWHLKWIRIRGVMIPRFYLSTNLLAILFLVASAVLAR